MGIIFLLISGVLANPVGVKNSETLESASNLWEIKIILYFAQNATGTRYSWIFELLPSPRQLTGDSSPASAGWPDQRSWVYLGESCVTTESYSLRKERRLRLTICEVWKVRYKWYYSASWVWVVHGCYHHERTNHLKWAQSKVDP